MLCKRPVSALWKCFYLNKVDSKIALNVKLSNSFKNYGKNKIQALIEAQYLHRVHAKWQITEGNSHEI